MTGGGLKSQTGGCSALKHQLQCLIDRKQIRVAKVIVHENYTKNTNDIALLKLGKDDPATMLSTQNLFSEDRVDLSVHSPVCLPDSSSDFVGQIGHVYGRKHYQGHSRPLGLIEFFCLCECFNNPKLNFAWFILVGFILKVFVG